VTLHLDAGAEADVVRLRETILASRDARGALLLGDDQEISDETVRSILQRWVSAYRDLTDQLREFDEGRADELFADLHQMRERAMVPVRMTTPIFNFQMETEELQLRPDLSIVSRRADPEVRRYIDAAWGSVLMEAGAPRAVPRFAITSTFEAAREGLDASPEMDRHERVISAMRLLGVPGSPHIAMHLVSPARPALRLSHTLVRDIGMSRGIAQFNPFADVFALRAPKEPRLVRLVEQLDERAVDTALTFALRRFADAHARTRDEDRIVDYWIALESMFSKESTEVTYRVSMRAARFIGGTADERGELRERLKRSYGVRSKIVHGGRVDARRLHEVEQHTIEPLRLALLRWLETGGTSPDALDAALLE
jgi:Apea-like HEPN